MLAAWRLGVVLAVVGSVLSLDLRKDLHDFKDGVQGRFRRFVIFSRPRVLHFTPDHLKPKANHFFDWLLNIKREPPSPRTTRRETSQELLQSRRAVPGERLSAADTQRIFARDLDIALGKFTLQVDMGNMVGESGTVMGTEGRVVWESGMERVNGYTSFEPGERVQFKGQSTFEFSVHVTYHYQLSSLGVKRTGMATTKVKHQQAILKVDLVRPNGLDDCYIQALEVEYSEVTGDLEVDIQAHSSGSMFSTGGKISSRLFPQCRSDFQKFIHAELPSPAQKGMTDALRGILKKKICEGAPAPEGTQVNKNSQ